MDASEFDAVRWSSIYYLYLYFGTEKQTERTERFSVQKMKMK